MKKSPPPRTRYADADHSRRTNALPLRVRAAEPSCRTRMSTLWASTYANHVSRVRILRRNSEKFTTS